MSQEPTLRSQRLYQGRIFNVRRDTVKLPSGQEATREIVEHGDCVAIVPLDEAGRVLLVRQFRKAVERELLEVPAGGIEAGESPDQCVLRELQEETGYTADSIERIGGFYSAPGYTSEFLHLYLATRLRPSHLKGDADESIELVRVPLSDIPRLIASGEICDAKSIAGLLTVIGLRAKREGQ